MSDSEPEFERPPLHNPNDFDFDEPIKEVVEDFTGEDESLSSDKSSLASLNLSDEAPSIKPRAYQLEMLEESLKHNIIVAADTGSGKTHM